MFIYQHLNTLLLKSKQKISLNPKQASFLTMKKYISANQFSHKSTRDAHQTLGFSLILAAQKIQRFQVASKNLPVALDHFPECENSKKKCLQPNHHLLCSMKHSVTVGKKTLPNSIKEVRIPKIQEFL